MYSNLYNRLLEYSNSDYYGFHMPGHKRNIDLAKMCNPFNIDITEITDFDNLHVPEGIIKEEMDVAKEIYGSKKTYFLVNGSSCGNMAAISSAVKPGDKIIIGRNSHKSVYNSVELLNLKVNYLYPQILEDYDIFGGYSLEDVREIIEKNKDAKALVITSPTYEGIVSDIRGICDIAHAYGIPVIVDSAHGAHFILSDEFPKTAVECGADIVIESLHKTLPSLTQTAVIHYNSEIIEERLLEKYLKVFQTSSPSYVLMSSICNCIKFINEDSEKSMWLAERIRKLKSRLNSCTNIKILDIETAHRQEIYDFDISKIVIFINNNIISGKELKDILNSKYHLEMEMAAGNYVLAMTSVFDTEEGFERLEKALKDIDDYLNCVRREEAVGDKFLARDLYSIRNNKVCEIFEVETFADETRCEMNYTYLYPPGIPIIVPGEIMSDRLNKILKEYKQAGYEVIVD